MKKYVLFVLLVFSAHAYAVDYASCNVSNLGTQFVGKGLMYGPKTTSGDELQGHIVLSFDYDCHAWADRLFGTPFETYGLSHSYSSGKIYRTNTYGVILKARPEVKTFFGDHGNLRLKTIYPGPFDIRTAGSISAILFDVYKNGEIGKGPGTGPGSSFSPGSVRYLTTEKPFSIRYVNSLRAHHITIINNYMLSTPIKVYNPTCAVSAPDSVDVGEIPRGEQKQRHFAISLSCNNTAVTPQSQILTKFTNVTPTSSMSGDARSIQYRGSDSVKVNMSIQDEVGNYITFGAQHEYRSFHHNSPQYNLDYTAVFDAMSDSGYDNFSFIINYEVTYN